MGKGKLKKMQTKTADVVPPSPPPPDVRSPKFGPWMGVPQGRQELCAVEGCSAPGETHRCIYDGEMHNHGCVHYLSYAAEVTGHGLAFREGWGLLCKAHYDALSLALARSL
jgi:hypothetical protein